MMAAISLYASRAINHVAATNVTIATLQHGYNVRQVGTASGCIIVELPFVREVKTGFFPAEASQRWFLLGDNGGEISVMAINFSTIYQSVPFDVEPAVTAELTAYRLAVVMAGQPVDWNFTDMLSIQQLMGLEGEPTIIRCNSPMGIYRG